MSARRGSATFAPLLETDYDQWKRRRGLRSPDRIKEVTVRGLCADAEAPHARRLVFPAVT
jgi:hypothetical protein